MLINRWRPISVYILGGWWWASGVILHVRGVRFDWNLAPSVHTGNKFIQEIFIFVAIEAFSTFWKNTKIERTKCRKKPFWFPVSSILNKKETAKKFLVAIAIPFFYSFHFMRQQISVGFSLCFFLIYTEFCWINIMLYTVLRHINRVSVCMHSPCWVAVADIDVCVHIINA